MAEEATGAKTADRWKVRSVPLRFQISDWTLFSISLPMQVRVESVFDEAPPVDVSKPLVDRLVEGSQGFVIHGLPVANELPRISRIGDYLRYVPLQYQHCYIDLSLSFETYQKKFSSKTRSTINRK